MIHYFHMWVDSPHWERLAQVHFDALQTAQFPGEIRLGLVGSSINRARALGHPLVAAGTVCAEADEGFEQVTLAAIRRDVQDMPDSEAVFYSHDKGSYHGFSNSTDPNYLWVVDVNDTLLRQWPTCVQILDECPVDVVSLHWGIADAAQGIEGQGYPVGNFWWARAGYLRTLPELSYGHRAYAETWVGSVPTRAHAIRPGMPEYPPPVRNCSNWFGSGVR